MISETIVVKSDCLDAFRNLAMEEYLLGNVKPGQCILFLWQNSDTIVIGKHQNPWNECRTEIMAAEGINLARRLSGGGAVFHDRGNINYTFVLKRESYDAQRQGQVIVNAVKSFGINAEITGRNDLTVNGMKFSGNAFCFRKDNAYHHGTVLISADMAKLARYLQPSKEKMLSKGVESVLSRVVNLQKLRTDITVERMSQALIRAFAAEYGAPLKIIEGDGWLPQGVLDELKNKYESWEWIFGKTPRFTVSPKTRFPWGGIELGLSMEDGMIKDATIYSDAMDVEFIEMLPAAFRGAEFQPGIIAGKIRAMILNNTQRRMAEDVALWLESLAF